VKRDPKANLKPFKPGQSGNPAGRPKTPDDILKANRLTAETFARQINKYLHLTVDELNADLSRPDASMIDLLVGGMVMKAAKDHDWQRANFILDRIIGKVKDPDQNVTVSTYNFSMLPREQVIELGKEAIKFLEDTKK
jgi:hypothetical protein